MSPYRQPAPRPPPATAPPPPPAGRPVAHRPVHPALAALLVVLSLSALFAVLLAGVLAVWSGLRGHVLVAGIVTLWGVRVVGRRGPGRGKETRGQKSS